MTDKEKKKKALIVGPGGLGGAYGGGVVYELNKELGSDYFDLVIGVSSGAYNATFYVADSVDIGKYMWLHCLGANRLIDYRRVFSDEEILNLEYLVSLFSPPHSTLDIAKIDRSSTRLELSLTNLQKVQPEYKKLTSKNYKALLKASSAVPTVHEPVIYNGEEYFDGGIINPLPVERAKESCDEVVVVHQKNLLLDNLFFYYFTYLFSPQARPLLQKRKTDEITAKLSDSDVHEIGSVRDISSFSLTFDKKQAKKDFALGQKSALSFLQSYSSNA